VVGDPVCAVEVGEPGDAELLAGQQQLDVARSAFQDNARLIVHGDLILAGLHRQAGVRVLDLKDVGDLQAFLPKPYRAQLQLLRGRRRGGRRSDRRSRLGGGREFCRRGHRRPFNASRLRGRPACIPDRARRRGRAIERLLRLFGAAAAAGKQDDYQQKQRDALAHVVTSLRDIPGQSRLALAGVSLDSMSASC